MTLNRVLPYLTVLFCSAVVAQTPLDSARALINAGEQTLAEQAKTYNAIGQYYIGVNQDSAALYLDKGLQVALESKSEEVIVLLKFGQALLHRNDWSLDSLTNFVQSFLSFHEENEDLPKQVVAHQNLGSIYSEYGKFEEAIKCNLNAIDLLAILGDSLKIGELTFNMGVTYFNASLYESAIDKFKSAYHVFRQVGHSAYAGLAMDGMINVFMETNQTDSAQKYIGPLMDLAEEAKFSVLALEAKITSGLLQVDQRNYEEASQIFLEAMDSSRVVGTGLNTLNCLCALGKINYHLGQFHIADDYYKQAYTFTAAQDNNLMKNHCLREYALTLQELNKQGQAFDLLKEYSDFQDTVQSKENKVVISELEVKYQSSKKDAEIVRQQLDITKKENTRNILIALLGLGAVTAILVVTRFRLRQKITSQDLSLQIEKNQNLQQKQKLLAIDYMVQGQEEERKRIAKDLHDGLGSLLLSAKMQLSNIHQGIKALENLDLFTKAEGLIENAHEEVRRIAHNMMPEALMNFGLKEAVQDFGHQINTSSEVQVVTNFYCETAELSEEVEIHLFRIIQEGVNNALKHADADLITIQFSKDEEYYLLEISDDGKGFDLEEGKGKEGIGLRNLESRVKYLNGDLTIASAPGQGTIIEVAVPCEL